MLSCWRFRPVWQVWQPEHGSFWLSVCPKYTRVKDKMRIEELKQTIKISPREVNDRCSLAGWSCNFTVICSCCPDFGHGYGIDPGPGPCSAVQPSCRVSRGPAVTVLTIWPLFEIEQHLSVRSFLAQFDFMVWCVLVRSTQLKDEAQ